MNNLTLLSGNQNVCLQALTAHDLADLTILANDPNVALLGAPFHGKGIMTEAVSLATAYAFQEMNIQRIYAGVFAPNEASKKVLLKNNYYLESIRKNAVIKNGTLYDDHFFVKLNT